MYLSWLWKSLSGIDGIPVRIREIGVVRIKLVVGDGEIGIIGHGIDPALEIGTGVGQIPIRHLALQGEGRKIPVVTVALCREIVNLQIAGAVDLRTIEEGAMRDLMLIH